MKELIFVRHGESQYNAFLTKNLNSELTSKGRQQAAETGKFLKNEIPHIAEFTAITSPYLRCLQTSRIIAGITGLEFKVSLGPRESMVSYKEAIVENNSHLFADFTWLHFSEIGAYEVCLNEEKNIYGWIFKQESTDEMSNRLKQFHSKLTNLKTIVVSHGSPITALDEITRGEEPRHSPYFVDNCGIVYFKENAQIWCGKTVYENNSDI